jgi:hypothetical protein
MAKASAEIRSLARAHTEKALKVLIGIMSQSKAPHAARVAAANSVLDRGWGKPNQTIEATINNVDPARVTDSELAAIVQTDGRSGIDPAPLDPSKFN